MNSALSCVARGSGVVWVQQKKDKDNRSAGVFSFCLTAGPSTLQLIQSQRKLSMASLCQTVESSTCPLQALQVGLCHNWKYLELDVFVQTAFKCLHYFFFAFQLSSQTPWWTQSGWSKQECSSRRSMLILLSFTLLFYNMGLNSVAGNLPLDVFHKDFQEQELAPLTLHMVCIKNITIKHKAL